MFFGTQCISQSGSDSFIDKVVDDAHGPGPERSLFHQGTSEEKVRKSKESLVTESQIPVLQKSWRVGDD